MQLTYRPPSGTEIADADVEQVIGHLSGSGESYWNSGSGGGLLIRGPEPDERRMQIFHLGDGLFQLAYSIGSGIEYAALPASPPPEPEYVKIQIGGERAKFSTAQAIGPEEAAEILRYFAASGEKSPSHEWGRVDWPE